MADRSQEIRNALVEKNIRLAKYLAAKAFERGKPPDLGLDDLESFAMFGLIDAVEKFDPTRGVKFVSYANYRIRGEIIDHLRNYSWVPRLAIQRKEDHPLFVPLPSMADIHDEDDDGSILIAQTCEPDPDSKLQESESWNKLVAGLNRKERSIIENYYLHGKSMREIGQEMNISESRVCQLRSRALGYLRNPRDTEDAEEEN